MDIRIGSTNWYSKYQLILETFIPHRQHEKWLTRNDPHESIDDKGDDKVGLSVVMSISIIHDDIIIGAPAIG